tara:strand:- start:1557 stop:1757 length:201 start_codon:yes stop_codon:yes gene_type:complete
MISSFSELNLLVACATCRPDPGSLMAQAQDQAVLFMLGALGLIFGVIFYTIFSFSRRQKRFAASQA